MNTDLQRITGFSDMPNLEQYKTISTADLCDKFSRNVKHIVMPFISLGGVNKICAPVETLFTSGDVSVVRAALSQEGKGRVLVVDVEKKFRHLAVFGDTLAGLALKNGWRGMIVGGSIRDVDILSSMPLLVMALGTCPIRSYGEGGGVQSNSISLGKDRVCSGDWIFIDADGILIIEKEVFQKNKALYSFISNRVKYFPGKRVT